MLNLLFAIPLVLTGQASYYHDQFEGLKTANGEHYCSQDLTAAHKSLPFGTRLVVTNKANKKQVTVRVNDRGPYAQGRILDLSKAAFKQIADIKKGVILVQVRILK